MRLEVLADNKSSVIYVLNRPEVYIGSSVNNDIVISSAEISKKHLKLMITEDQKCFAIDQGSTNGTFLNDLRLVPGKRELVPLFSSLRLGDRVLLTLLDKDKGSLPELPLREQFLEEKKIAVAEEDKTRVISLKTLQKTKTEKVKKKRLKKLEKELKKKKTLRNDKAILNQAIFTALIVIGLGFGAKKVWDQKRKERGTIVGAIKETQIMIDDRLEFVDDSAADLRIPQSLLLTTEEISRHAQEVNCSLPEEVFFCKRIPREKQRRNGALNLNGQIVIYLEQSEWLEKAQELVATHAEISGKDGAETEGDTGAESFDEEEKKDVTQADIRRIAFLSFLKTYLGKPLPADYQVLNIYIVLYSKVGGETDVESIMALRGSVLSQVNARYTEDFFRFKKYNPYSILRKLDRFYRIY